jgi:hypothetical protein
MSNDFKKAAFLEHLVLMGAIEMDGIDSNTGEMIYSITENLEFVNPDLYDQLKKQYNDHMFSLIKQGPMTMKWKINQEFLNG